MYLHLWFVAFILLAKTISAADSDLRAPFNEFRKSGQFTDCKIIIESGKEFLCHRAILVLASDYFLKMFSSGLLESELREIKLGFLYEQTAETLLNIIYEPSKKIDAIINFWSYIELKTFVSSLLSERLIEAVARLEIEVPPAELDWATDYIVQNKDRDLAEKIGAVRDRALSLDKPCFKIKSRADWVKKKHFNANETRQIVISGNTVNLLNTIDKSVILNLPIVSSNIKAITLSPDGTRVVTIVEWRAKLWNVSNSELSPIDIQGSIMFEGFFDAEFSSDGTRLLLYNNYGVAVFNAFNGDCVKEFGSGNACREKSSSFSTDGNLIVTINWDGNECRIHEVASGTLVAKIPSNEYRKAVSFNYEGNKVLLIGYNSISIYDIANKKEFINIETNNTRNAAFAPYDGSIESESSDGIIREWVYPVKLIFDIDLLLKDQNAKHLLVIRNQFAQYRNGHSIEKCLKKTKEAMEKLIPEHALLLRYYQALFGI